MKLGYFFFILIFILAACSSFSGSENFELNGSQVGEIQDNLQPIIPEDTELAINIEQRDELVDAQAQATFASQFQSFFLDPDKVKVIDSREVEWSDSCLGIEQPGVECISQVTQGYEIKLEANGLQFDYHADQVGGMVQPATLGLIWTREGGEDQLCDRLIIYLPDVAHTCWCNSGEMHATSVNLQEILSMEEYEQFVELLRYFSKNTFDQTTEGDSGPIKVSLMFHGQGSTSAESTDQETLLVMAENIFSRIIP